MTGVTLRLAGLLAGIVLAGCSGSDQTTGKAGEAEGSGVADKTGAAAGESVFDPMLETIDKAKQVEQLSEDRVRQLNQQLEEAEGSK